MSLILSPETDLFETDAAVLVNTVNCVGVMGKGVALSFKQRWPHLMPPYQKLCSERKILPGTCTYVRMSPETDKISGVLLLATKDHWRNQSQIEWIDSGLAQMAEVISGRQISKVACPWPGCGNGGLNREAVQPLLEKHLSELEKLRPNLSAKCL